MPVEAIDDPRVLREVLATVEDIRENRGRSENSENRAASPVFEVDIGIAAETTGAEASQLINMLFGNCSLQPEVELVDVQFPAGYEKHFPGPRYGIAGIRTLVGAQGRALTCTALKPQGSPVEHLAQLARTFALAGIDVIKDDHGIANQAPAPFEQRVPAVMR